MGSVEKNKFCGISGGSDSENNLYTDEINRQFALNDLGDLLYEYTFNTDKKTYLNKNIKRSGNNFYNLIDETGGFESCIHPEDIENVRRNMISHLAGKSEIFESEYRLLCNDKSYKWVFDRGKVFNWDEKGNPSKMIGIIMDLTLQKRMQNSLLQNMHKEKQLNEMKSRFVSMASHELRTPMSTMLMIIDSLAAYRGKMSENDIEKKIKKLNNNIMFMKNIIDKTLNLTKLETGKIEINLISTELNELIQKIIENFQISYNPKHNISFCVTNKPLILRIDKQLIKEIIINLITNSIKYSSPESPVQISIIKNEDYINIQISDEGIGIPGEDKGHIFEAFHRGSNVDNTHGTGLGLTLSKKFARMHGGDITFKSKTNSGSIFIISLPKLLMAE